MLDYVQALVLCAVEELADCVEGLVDCEEEL